MVDCNMPKLKDIRWSKHEAVDLLNHRFLVTDKASLEAFLDGSAWDDSGKGDA